MTADRGPSRHHDGPVTGGTGPGESTGHAGGGAAIDDLIRLIGTTGATPWATEGISMRAIVHRAYLRALRPYLRRRAEVDAAIVRSLRGITAEAASLRAEAGAIREVLRVTEDRLETLADALASAGARARGAEERARRAEGALALHLIDAGTPARGALDATICTVVSRATIAHAHALARSVERVHPGTRVIAVITDDEAVDLGALPFVPAHLDAVVADAHAWRARHDGIALEYAATPDAIRFALDQADGPVIFIKQESMVVGSLQPVLDGLGHSALALIPHVVAAPTGDDADERTRDILLAGTFNGGVIAAANSAAAREMLAWWSERVRGECVHDVERGRHFEQRWLDLLAAVFDGVAVLRGPGLNVGHWNIGDRVLSGAPGHLRADGHEVAVLRFSGFDPGVPDVLTRYAPDRLAGSRGALDTYLAAFRHELITHSGMRP